MSQNNKAAAMYSWLAGVPSDKELYARKPFERVAAMTSGMTKLGPYAYAW